MAAALRQMGLSEAPNCSLDHHGLNRAQGSALAWGRRLRAWFVRTLVAAGGALTCVIDATVARRGGRRLTTRGHDRDPLASSPPGSVAPSGVRWLVLTWVISPPWTQRSWALPVLPGPAPTPAVSRRLGRRQPTVPRRARHMLLLVRRWWPGVAMTVLGDPTSRVHERAGTGARRDVRWVAPLRMDAAWSVPAPPRRPGPNGRPRVTGARVPPLEPVLKAAQTLGQRGRVSWYHGRRRELAVSRGTAVWDRMGQPVVPIRWVRVRDPTGRLEPRADVSTCPNDRPRAIVHQVVNRWTMATTCAASRAHLGFETQCQWSDRAMERATPCLFGLYAVVVLLGHALHPDGKVPVPRTAGSAKSDATFADVLAAVRHHVWGNFTFSPSTHDSDLVGIPRSARSRLAQAVCYAH